MDQEIDEELREIKREIIESRGLVIKTNNLTNALGADIRSIAKRQNTYERRITWTSASSYVVFVIVVFTALKLAMDARIDQLKAESDQRIKDIGRLKDELARSNERETARHGAEERAAKFYDLIRQGRRSDIVAQWEQTKTLALSKAELAFLSDAVERTRNELAAQLYQQGLEKLRAQHWQDAASAFEESIKYREDASIGPAVRLGLAEAYRHTSRAREAAALLAPLADNPIDKEVHDDALALLAQCQTELQAWNDAKNTWRTLLRRFPESHFAGEAKMQLAQLHMMH